MGPVYLFASHSNGNQEARHPAHRQQSRSCGWRKRTMTTLVVGSLVLLWCTSSHAALTLQGTTLQGTTLQGTTLQGTTLQGTTLQGTTLQGAIRISGSSVTFSCS